MLARPEKARKRPRELSAQCSPLLQALSLLLPANTGCSGVTQSDTLLLCRGASYIMHQHGMSALVRVDLSPAFPQDLPLITLRVSRDHGTDSPPANVLNAKARA